MGLEPWPKEAAQKIMDEAANADLPDGVEMVKKLAKIVMGDVALVESYSKVWIPESTDSLTETQDEFNSLVVRVNDMWMGPAADEFKAWVTTYRTAMKDCKDAMKAPQETLWSCSSTITKTYAAAIRLVARIASALIDLTTGVVSIPMDLLGLIGDLVKTFITEAANIIADALVLMQEYRAAMAKMGGAVSALAQLVPMGHVVGDPGGWQPRPAPTG